jgi:poly-gamma-glutamate capsule biosynthesis protein CapA/YwtB (metallophosphatase superfamily)
MGHVPLAPGAPGSYAGDMGTLVRMLAVVLVAGCAAGPGALAPTEPTARLLFAGDLMLGRRVGPVAAAEGAELFEGIRHVVSSADLAAANLESPLTHRPHLSSNPNELRADPALAPLVAGAGFDLMSVANNHTIDSGPGGLDDTIRALGAVGVVPVGGGPAEPVFEDVHGIRVAFLAFDASGVGIPAYSPAEAHAAVEAARRSADLVVVSLHGGVEYLLDPDPLLGPIATDLVGWGADVVWGHGPHVPQPVTTLEAGGRTGLVATSLGNLLFDQQRAVTQTGMVLEVLVSADGVEAFRTGRVDHRDLRPRFTGWDLPGGSAVLLDGAWWTPVGEIEWEAPTAPTVDGFPWGDVIAAGTGDVTGDGHPDLIVSYRHPFRTTEANLLFPDRDLTDASGRSAHLGVFDPDTFEPVWGAGTLLTPVARLAVCDGAVALAFDTIDDSRVVATGAWTWWDFGFAVAEPLPGPGTPGCVDLDRDGADEPVIVDRG